MEWKWFRLIILYVKVRFKGPKDECGKKKMGNFNFKNKIFEQISVLLWCVLLLLQERFAYLLTEMGQDVPTEADFNSVDLVRGLKNDYFGRVRILVRTKKQRYFLDRSPFAQENGTTPHNQIKRQFPIETTKTSQKFYQISSALSSLNFKSQLGAVHILCQPTSGVPGPTLPPC